MPTYFIFKTKTDKFIGNELKPKEKPGKIYGIFNSHTSESERILYKGKDVNGNVLNIITDPRTLDIQTVADFKYYYPKYESVNLLMLKNPTLGCVGKVVGNYKKTLKGKKSSQNTIISSKKPSLKVTKKKSKRVTKKIKKAKKKRSKKEKKKNPSLKVTKKKRSKKKNKSKKKS